MTKRNITFICLFLSVFSLSAQSLDLSYKLYGFVENQFIFDSRQYVGGSGGLLNFMPLPEKPDADGKDLNAVPTAEIVSVNARVGLDVGGLELEKAKLTAKIEADFAGVPSSTGYFSLRLRRAFVQSNWKNAKLLLGQDWHPLSSAVMPSTYGLNGGAPFNPFNRSPQLNFKYDVNKWQFTAAAVYQMQYCSDGPEGKGGIYLRRAIIPDMFLGVQNTIGSFRYGIGGDVKMLKPRTSSTVNVEDTGNFTYSVKEKIISYSGMLYGEYAKNKLIIKGKAVYGQNLTDVLMVGGYGVTDIDPVTGKQDYESFNSVSAWANVVYGKKWRVGLFGGYLQNLGTNSPLSQSNILYMGGYGYAEGQMMDYMYRIIPQFSFNLSHWVMGIEYDLTGATFGKADLSNGKAVDTHQVINHRILCLVRYVF